MCSVAPGAFNAAPCQNPFRGRNVLLTRPCGRSVYKPLCIEGSVRARAQRRARRLGASQDPSLPGSEQGGLRRPGPIGLGLRQADEAWRRLSEERLTGSVRNIASQSDQTGNNYFLTAPMQPKHKTPLALAPRPHPARILPISRRQAAGDRLAATKRRTSEPPISWPRQRKGKLSRPLSGRRRWGRIGPPAALPLQRKTIGQPALWPRHHTGKEDRVAHPPATIEGMQVQPPAPWPPRRRNIEPPGSWPHQMGGRLSRPPSGHPRREEDGASLWQPERGAPQKPAQYPRDMGMFFVIVRFVGSGSTAGRRRARSSA